MTETSHGTVSRLQSVVPARVSITPYMIAAKHVEACVFDNHTVHCDASLPLERSLTQLRSLPSPHSAASERSWSDVYEQLQAEKASRTAAEANSKSIM